MTRPSLRERLAWWRWAFRGLGTGLTELPTRAPKIHAYIEERIRQLEEGT